MELDSITGELQQLNTSDIYTQGFSELVDLENNSVSLNFTQNTNLTSVQVLHSFSFSKDGGGGDIENVDLTNFKLGPIEQYIIESFRSHQQAPAESNPEHSRCKYQYVLPYLYIFPVIMLILSYQ